MQNININFNLRFFVLFFYPTKWICKGSENVDIVMFYWLIIFIVFAIDISYVKW